MEAHQRIKALMNARGWTEYRLAKESGLSQSTIANIYRRNTIPNIATLGHICSAFGITLAQFFAEGNFVELNDEQKYFFDKWVSLTKEQKSIIEAIVKNMK